jgi:hypothetical protein
LPTRCFEYSAHLKDALEPIGHPSVSNPPPNAL